MGLPNFVSLNLALILGPAAGTVQANKTVLQLPKLKRARGMGHRVRPGAPLISPMDDIVADAT